MRIIQCLPMCFIFIATAAQALQTPGATVTATATATTTSTSASTSVIRAPVSQGGWFYQDKDGDLYCDEDSGKRANSCPSGWKAYVDCAGGEGIFDTNDSNAYDSPDHPASNATVEDYAAWTLNMTPTQAKSSGTINTRAYAKVMGEITSCQKDANGTGWLVNTGTCACEKLAGYYWVPTYKDGVYGGECHLRTNGGGIRTPGNGGYGYDSKARKAAEQASKDLDTHKADPESHKDIRNLIDANAKADNDAWNKYRADKAAEDKTRADAKAKFEEDLVKDQEAQDDAIKAVEETQIGIEGTLYGQEVDEDGEVIRTGTKNRPLKNGLKPEFDADKRTHPENGFELGGTFASQSFVKDSGVVLRGDGYKGLTARGVFGGRFLNYGLAQVFLEGAAVSETADVAGVSTSLAGFRGAAGLQAGGVIPVTTNFEISPVAFIGYGGSSTAGANKAQGGVTGRGTIFGGAIYGWYNQVGLGLRLTERLERTEHSVLFETNDQNVTAGNLKPVSRPGATTTVIDLVVAMRF